MGTGPCACPGSRPVPAIRTYIEKRVLFTYPSRVYHINPGFGEIPDVARRHGHPARKRDRCDLAIRLRDRTPGGAAGSCYVRIGARRAAVERQNAV